ncbi:SIR2 family protein [Kosakonia radicincitans]|uniref:SIR2 family protein n=1 Tax=Kosakonia radicincitans TaxID=283686 RepID=UPI0008C7CE7C|nr:SIR2 family protein [Kosakonia radicincitans]MDD7995700.1 SIR2 family protein [Kosakonia radicincitans]SET08365.1 SIR2-like domain-containing protein [Kosakonia radicincitans]
MDSVKDSFIKHICKELQDENVAIFAGAGMSAGAGFVSWAELLRPIADELGLDVDKEHDLVALAQFHCNSNGNNRSQLNQRLIEEFSRDTVETDTHRILARLPITTYWTTNYDKLIESSLIKSGKSPDVKYTKEQLAVTKLKRDAIVYKMHGDIDHANSAVLTKDDYERYYIKMDQYLSALKGDLISKTFIFIGFSFTDPNLDYILSRVRVAYDGNQRRHYCFIKSIDKKDDESDADYEYKCRKQKLFISDLSRFNIKTIMVESYDEIRELLRLIELNYKKKTIFISGAAHEYGNWNENESHIFISNLSSNLIRDGYKIVSGFGLGVGSAVISGALEEVYIHQNSPINDQLLLRPFPQSSTSQSLKALWTQYRDDMISHAGFTLFLFGNKITNKGVDLSDGMREEYIISKEKKNITLPIGSTGYMAKKLWEEECQLLDKYENKDNEFYQLFLKLGDEKATLNEVLVNTLNIIAYCVKKGDLHG